MTPEELLALHDKHHDREHRDHEKIHERERDAVKLLAQNASDNIAKMMALIALASSIAFGIAGVMIR